MRNKRKQRIKNIALVAYTVALVPVVAVLMVKSLDHPGEQHISGSEYTAQIAQYTPAEPVVIPTVVQREVVEPVKLYDVPLDAELQIHIIRTCEEHHIDPAIIFAMAWSESRYTVDAIGDDGNALGMLQIWPYWHSGRMGRLGCDDLLDPYQNVVVGIDYLAEQIERYDGDVAAGLTSYNAGHYSGTVTEYALSVLEMAEELRGEHDARELFAVGRARARAREVACEMPQVRALRRAYPRRKGVAHQR